jgi:type I restriction enzyme S subunit
MSRDKLTIVPPRGVDLPQLPQSWAWTYLGAILTRILAGKSFRCEERPPTESEYGVVKVSAVTWGTYNDGESKTITDDERVNLDYIIRSGDFLFSRANTIELVGACVVVNETRRKLLLSDKILRFDFAGDFKSWINWMLKSRLGRRQIEALSTGNQESMRNIGQVEIRRICVPVPPANEQHRIVAKIDELFSELDKGTEALIVAGEQLNAYRQSVLKQAFTGKLTEGWRSQHPDKTSAPDARLATIRAEADLCFAEAVKNWHEALRKWQASGNKGPKPAKPHPHEAIGNPEIPDHLAEHCTGRWAWLRLGDVSEVTGGLTKNPKRSALAMTMKYLRVANVYADRLELDDVAEIGVTEGEFESLRLQKGDLLVVEGNGSVDQIGRVAMWGGEIEGVGHQNHLIRVRLLAGMSPRFFLSFLMSPLGRDLIVRQASSTSGLHTLSISKVSSLPVPVPSLEEQEAVLAALEAPMSEIEKFAEEIETGLAKCAAIRQAILKKAFSGQLVAQYPKDEPASALLELIRAEREGATTEKGRTNKNGRKKAA